MSINTRLPVFNISTQKLSLSADTESVLWCGVEYPTVNFVSVVVPSLLAYLPPYSAGSIHLLSEMDANGSSIRGYGKHATAWGETIVQRREEHERRIKEVQEHQERLSAMYATPAEIAEDRAAKARKAEEAQRKFGRKGAAFGL